MDPQLNRCVNETFSQMYADGLIYRGHRIVNWDPKLQTNVSDDEVDRKEVASPSIPFSMGLSKLEQFVQRQNLATSMS